MLNNRLRELRKNDLKISGTEKLAEILGGEAAGWYHQKLQRIKSGKTPLTDKDAAYIARKLNVPLYALFVDPDTIYPAQDRRIIDAYRALRPGKMKDMVNGLLFPEEMLESLIERRERRKIAPPAKTPQTRQKSRDQ